jgi:hypothetical protein
MSTIIFIHDDSTIAFNLIIRFNDEHFLRAIANKQESLWIKIPQFIVFFHPLCHDSISKPYKGVVFFPFAFLPFLFSSVKLSTTLDVWDVDLQAEFSACYRLSVCKFSARKFPLRKFSQSDLFYRVHSDNIDIAL